MVKRLKISEVAKFAGCHYQTVRNYCNRGLLNPDRDVNNRRIFSLDDAEKLKRILSARWPSE